MSSASDSDSAASSNDSSAGSNDSSANSNQSSQNSNDSTAGSNQGSEQSSDETTAGTAESVGQSVVGTLAVGVILLTVGAGIGGTILLVRSGRRDQPVPLEQYLEQHHDLLLREVSTARGPTLSTLFAQSGLTSAETMQTLHELDGSTHQVALLDALDGPIGPRNARSFARSYCDLIAASVGDARYQQLLTVAEERLHAR